MAYLDLAAGYVAGAAPVSPPAALAPVQSFSALEWTVIALARKDGLRSIGEPGPIARALRSLFGEGRRSSLADPRLEALRRFAIHAWHRGYALPVSEIKAFVAAGFSIDQAEAALASIAGARAPQPRTVRG